MSMKMLANWFAKVCPYPVMLSFKVIRAIWHYPHYKGHDARVIDNYEKYAHSLIDLFGTTDKYPQIAILGSITKDWMDSFHLRRQMRS
jgi:hypothetical protein